MLKYLKADEQTISDLSIFGRSGKSSVYDLYNKTSTQGGSAKLEELFRHPLSDENAINAKAELFKFFSLHDHRFPLDSETIGGLAYYLENNDIRSQIQVGGQSIAQKLRDMVAADPEYVFAHNGVQAALRLFYKMGRYIVEWQEKEKSPAFAEMFERLQMLLTSVEFDLVRKYSADRFEVKLSAAELSDLDKQIRFEHRNKVLALLDVLYDLDVAISVGQTALKRGFRFARAMPKNSGVLNYRQVYHPHVEGAIANDLYLSSQHNLLFLTGANMAGKSTLMKSIGIALYLAHMGFPVAAEEFEFAVRDGIFTSINLADNLSMGASHYYAEVLRVKEVAIELKSGKQLFVIFDELFRGTNVKDAYDATIALTRAFSKQFESQFIISTHIMEAGEVLQKEELPIKYQYLPTVMEGAIPVYTRILKDGITADRQGMIIIQNEGILEMLDAGIKEKEEQLCLS